MGSGPFTGQIRVANDPAVEFEQSFDQVIGGGSQPKNWCQISFATKTLTVAAEGYTYKLADLSITAQSGTDFSLVSLSGMSGPYGAVKSAAGGRFQSAVYVGANQNNSATLDGGSAQQRYLEFLLSMGPDPDDDPDNPDLPVGQLGIDTFVPILPNGSPQIGSLASTPLSTPGWSKPGKACCYGIGVILVNGFGTDSVVVDANYNLTIFQVA